MFNCTTASLRATKKPFDPNSLRPATHSPCLSDAAHKGALCWRDATLSGATVFMRSLLILLSYINSSFRAACVEMLTGQINLCF